VLVLDSMQRSVVLTTMSLGASRTETGPGDCSMLYKFMPTGGRAVRY